MTDKKPSSPYKNTFFLLFVIATFISNTGTWLFTVGSSWLMTELDSSALMVSLVQTATLIPLFILAIPTGALGDIYNQKKIIIISQSLLIVNTLIFAYLVYLDKASVSLLLIFTFLNGVGAAFSRPVLAALTPQLVQKKHLRTAVNLTGIAYNLSRALGPILAGSLITLFAIDMPFWLDAISFGAVVIVIAFWKYEKPKDSLPDQKLSWAMRDSIRFLRYTPALYHSIIRAILFFFPTSALWALLPLVAKEQFSGTADLYGYLLGAAGLGAVTSVLFSNYITKKLGSSKLTFIVSALLGASIFLIGFTGSIYVALAFCFIAGICWQLAFTSVMTSTHHALPKWFGARGMAYFLMAMSGSMGIGSAVWGGLVDFTSLQYGLYGAGVASAVIGFLAMKFPLDMAKDGNFKMATDLPELSISREKDNGGWVMVLITYEVDENYKEKSIEKIKKIRNKRYRSGAVKWKLFQSSENENHLVESYYEISIEQLLIHQNQVTKYDRESEKDLNQWIEDNGGRIVRKYYQEL
ncbi:MFS transporter [Aquimarina sp. U1-2]|uniref:MFS transporter n=1 Tax=Aquimarina sp. U1-2 TaxID=2823141 RepID=UPI001AECF23D|nr:MFS transporter [Aquimarina sp. U1-2]MBP2831101.1 MFS transporter [Aquimarina sp. U1-2]